MTEYLNIPAPFFRDHKQIFDDLITSCKHGKWTECHLWGDFICLVNTIPHFAQLENGALSVYDRDPCERWMNFWSVSRTFDPDTGIDAHDADIEIFAHYGDFDAWHFDGKVRLEFLAGITGATLEKQLLDAMSTTIPPDFWKRKI